jgi:hypothetical protein
MLNTCIRGAGQKEKRLLAKVVSQAGVSFLTIQSPLLNNCEGPTTILEEKEEEEERSLEL